MGLGQSYVRTRKKITKISDETEKCGKREVGRDKKKNYASDGTEKEIERNDKRWSVHIISTKSSRLSGWWVQ